MGEGGLLGNRDGGERMGRSAREGDVLKEDMWLWSTRVEVGGRVLIVVDASTLRHNFKA